MKRYIFILLLLLTCRQLFSQVNTCGFRVSKKDKREFSAAIADTASIVTESLSQMVIPVIFHVLYDSDTENISDALILQELAQLNLDFTGENADISRVPDEYLSLVGTAGISFILADSMSPGMDSKGIIRKKATRNVYTFDDDIFNGDPVWDPEKYMNVYIGNIRNGSTSGYVNSFPWRNRNHDAIGLHFDKVGHSTRLLTHETGHWFGLWHINEGKCSAVNDEVGDTPPQKRLTGGCPSRKTECGKLSLIQNYMDYSSCRVMFTEGQVERMRMVIRRFRARLSVH
jgi:hypothetical protein